MSALISPIYIRDVGVDLGSDWHLDLSIPHITSRAVTHIVRHRTSGILFLPGDIFETRHGEDSSQAINELLEELSKLYECVLFCPGNHDLRGRDNPWDSFLGVPRNVITPPLGEVVIEVIGDIRILVANVFYDMQFIDPNFLGLTIDQITGQYATSNDRFLLDGDLSGFPAMTELAAKNLTSHIDILMTHTLPHPALVTFRVETITPEIQALQENRGLNFICNPEEDRIEAERWGTSAQEFRDWWNIKSFFMGSNVLGHPSASPRPGITSVYGHHHRNDSGERIINGIPVNFITHQMNQQDPKMQVDL